MNKKFILFPLVALLISCNPTQPSSEVPQVRTISGTISAYGQAVEGVDVSIRSLSFNDTTDSDGSFSIQLDEANSKANTYVVQTSHNDYSPANYVVKNSDFNSDGVANISINLASLYLRVYGVVSGENGPLENVEVNIGGSQVVTTNSNGEYDVTIERPVDTFTIQYYKEYYGVWSEVIDHSNLQEVEKNITLTKVKLGVQGKVRNYFFGDLADVKVSILDTDYETTTTEDGTFSFSDITSIALPLNIKFEKDGYLTRTEKWSYNNQNLDIEMLTTPVEINNIAPSIGAFNGEIARSEEGLHFYFESPRKMQYSKETSREEKLQIYVDVNETTSNRTGDTIVEFALTSNDNIVVAWNHKTNSAATMLDWDNEVVYTSIISEEKTILSLFVDYDAFADIGADFAIENDAVIGFAFGFWSDFVSPSWEGWSNDKILGSNGLAFVEPADPRDYVRYSPEGKLYQNDNNEYIAPITRTITGVVANEDNEPIEGAIVKVKNTPLGVMTNIEGRYEIILENEWFAVKPTIAVSKEGYAAIEYAVEQDDFINGIANINVTLNSATSAEADAGMFGIAPWHAYASMGQDKLTFRLVTQGQFAVPQSGENNVSIYVAFGETYSTQAQSSVLEFKFNPNNWIGVWNYKINGWQLWKPDVAYTISKTGAITELTVSVTYAYINEIDGFTINPGDEVGISFGQWIDGNDPVWLGWTYDGSFIDPAIPTSYIRLNNKNQLSKPN